QLRDVELRAEGHDVYLAREHVRDDRIHVADVANDDAIDLRSPQEVLVERRPFDRASQGPTHHSVRPEADPLRIPQRAVLDRGPVTRGVKVPEQVPRDGRDAIVYADIPQNRLRLPQRNDRVW